MAPATPPVGVAARAGQEECAEALAIERSALHVELRDRDDELAEIELQIVELEVGGGGGIRQEEQQERRRRQRPGAGEASAGRRSSLMVS
jgi:hypothetical protein